MNRFNPEQALMAVRREFGEHGGVAPSIERASTFTVEKPGTMPDIFSGIKGPDAGGCYLYSRHFNPTVDVLARYLAAIESTEAAICTASGISAIACTLLQLCRRGDHIVCSDTIYGGTHALIAEVLPDMGIDAAFIDPADTAAFEAALNDRTKVIYVETMANPTLKVADLPALSALARDRGISLVVDNTFTPMLVTPRLHGADVVIHSLTKYINGASDLIGGVVCGSRDLILRMMDLHTGRVMLLGPTMDPRTAFDVMQRLPHLAIRMREHGARALHLAQRLKEWGVPVIYPGLPAHPHHDRLRGMLNEGYGWGGMLAIDCGSQERAGRLADVLQNRFRFGLIAVSLGYFDTLMSCSSVSTSSEIPAEEQSRMGLSPGLLRLSIGFTGTLEDRERQLAEALKSVDMLG